MYGELCLYVTMATTRRRLFNGIIQFPIKVLHYGRDSVMLFVLCPKSTYIMAALSYGLVL